MPSLDRAADEAEAASAAVTADTRIAADDATWDDAAGDRVDHYTRPSTPRGVLLAAAAGDARDARRWATEARELRAQAADLEDAAANAAHRLSGYRAALTILDAKHRNKEPQ